MMRLRTDAGLRRKNRFFRFQVPSANRIPATQRRIKNKGVFSSELGKSGTDHTVRLAVGTAIG
jgi:hypothetical protein